MEEIIFSRLNEDLRSIEKLYGEENVFGCFLNNDITESIVIPTFEEVCLNKKLINTNYIYKDRLINIKDIRFAYHATRDGYKELISGLYTDKYLINPKYERLYLKLLRANREIITQGANSGVPAEELKIALMKIMRAAMNDNSAAVRFIKILSDVEKLALEEIINTVGDEGIFSQAKIASSSGISKVAIQKLINNMDLYGVAIINYLGQKGTYIKIIDDTLLHIRG